MTDPLGSQDDAATPLDAEERKGLIPSYITLRRELNEAEQANILEAETWAFTRKREVLSESALNNLHKRMFGHVWKWAGRFRTTEKNICAFRLVRLHASPGRPSRGRTVRRASSQLRTVGRISSVAMTILWARRARP
jgi:fido (protein-threonine AMPylation protein)